MGGIRGFLKGKSKGDASQVFLVTKKIATGYSKKRYARGEIDKKEFEEKKRDYFKSCQRPITFPSVS